jgi:hypothetical protein
MKSRRREPSAQPFLAGLVASAIRGGPGSIRGGRFPARTAASMNEAVKGLVADKNTSGIQCHPTSPLRDRNLHQS